MDVMNPPEIDTILFDFDGTLAPNLDLPDMRRQVVDLTEQANVPKPVYTDRYIVEVIDASYNWLKQDNPSDAERYYRNAHQLITDFEMDAAASTEPFPGIVQRLRLLRESDKKLGVVTRNCRAAVLQVFPDIMRYVDALYARDDTPHLKPDPRHLSACLDDIKALPTRTAMVGDGALDMRAGRELNMYCVGVLSGSADESALRAAGAHQVIDHCVDLMF